MSSPSREALYRELTTNTSDLKKTFLVSGSPKLIAANMDFVQSVQDTLERAFDREGGQKMMSDLLTEVKKADKLEQFIKALGEADQSHLVRVLNKRLEELEELDLL